MRHKKFSCVILMFIFNEKILVHTIRSTQYEYTVHTVVVGILLLLHTQYTREINNGKKLKGRYLFSKVWPSTPHMHTVQYSTHKSFFDTLLYRQLDMPQLTYVAYLPCGTSVDTYAYVIMNSFFRVCSYKYL